ncbi:MAG: DUF4215 domain-containing protein [Candidatus Peregrinibacteria bacterium]
MVSSVVSSSVSSVASSSAASSTESSVVPPTHLACVGYSCQTVAGAGADSCSKQLDCGTETHLECSGNSCVQIAGAGPNLCGPQFGCGPFSHLECVSNTCRYVPGTGVNSCTLAAGCGSDNHLECQNDACIQVSGIGANECTSQFSCLDLTHYECRNNTCTQVSGGGTDSCTTAVGCSQQTHMACVNNSCTSVIGVGDNTCGTSEDCPQQHSASSDSGCESGSIYDPSCHCCIEITDICCKISPTRTLPVILDEKLSGATTLGEIHGGRFQTVAGKQAYIPGDTGYIRYSIANGFPSSRGALCMMVSPLRDGDPQTLVSTGNAGDSRITLQSRAANTSNQLSFAGQSTTVKMEGAWMTPIPGEWHMLKATWSEDGWELWNFNDPSISGEKVAMHQNPNGVGPAGSSLYVGNMLGNGPSTGYALRNLVLCGDQQNDTIFVIKNESTPVCGNGIVQYPETCDEGYRNGTSTSTCTNQCKLLPSSRTTDEAPPSSCGDGIIQTPEECDWGNQNGLPSSSCNAECRINQILSGDRCGNGILDQGEECDDGNWSPGDGCDGQCRAEPLSLLKKQHCGNGVRDLGEECDDGNTLNGDGCSGVCTQETGFCGNGIIESALGEQCEPSLQNSHTLNKCGSDCHFLIPLCGNGAIDTGEECDDGTGNANVPNAHCRKDCRLARCGDGIRDRSEECDDGKTVSGDGCSMLCRNEISDPVRSVIGSLKAFVSTQDTPLHASTTPPSPESFVVLPQFPEHAPIGKTGPAAAVAVAAGAGAGCAWIRRRRRR